MTYPVSRLVLAGLWLVLAAVNWRVLVVALLVLGLVRFTRRRA